MKRYLGLGTLLAASVIFVPNGGRPRLKEKDQPSGYQQKANSAPKTSSARPSASAAAPHPEAPGKQHTSEQKKRDFWETAFSPESAPRWALVLVGIVAAGVALRTLGAINQQACQTSRSASAMEKNIKLQVIAMRQWVSADDWRINITGRDADSVKLDICFSVTNPTSRPLTLLSGRVGIDGQESVIPSNIRLVPQGRYPVVAAAELKGEQKQRFDSGGLQMNILGVIYYRNTLGETVPQHFGVTTQLRRGIQPLFSPYVGNLPYPVNGEGADPQDFVV